MTTHEQRKRRLAGCKRTIRRPLLTPRATLRPDAVRARAWLWPEPKGPDLSPIGLWLTMKGAVRSLLTRWKLPTPKPDAKG